MLKQFRYPSNRQALMAAVCSGILLFTLVILWLAISTHTALMSRQLDAYDAQLAQITDETNSLWKQIGDITAPLEMDRRMRDAGYTVPDRVEFLMSQPTATVVSSTVTLSGGGR
ncbi:MAG: hypothetical protein M1434_05700 [Chloroflexi bacterium]|nr:hypothetical protein [Chloroflexota bacterium]